MSIEEKRPIVSIMSNLLTFWVYYTIVFDIYNQGSYTMSEELKFWAAVILILIPVLIVSKIVLYIIFSIVNTIFTGEHEKFLTDEFGRLIEARSTRNFYNVFMAGFLLALVAAVLGMSLTIMFNVFLFSILGAGIVLDISQLYYLRKGI